MEFKGKSISQNIIKLFNILKFYSDNGIINIDIFNDEIIIIKL